MNNLYDFYFVPSGQFEQYEEEWKKNANNFASVLSGSWVNSASNYNYQPGYYANLSNKKGDDMVSQLEYIIEKSNTDEFSKIYKMMMKETPRYNQENLHRFFFPKGDDDKFFGALCISDEFYSDELKRMVTREYKKLRIQNICVEEIIDGNEI